MKFNVIMILVAVLAAASTTAQHASIGIKAGLNLYNINNGHGAEWDAKTGFHAGLLSHIHLSKTWAIQPELVYSEEGAKSSFTNVDTKINLGYINLPVMIQYMFNNGFRLQAGPQLGFLTGANAENNNIKTDMRDEIKTVDFALGFGAAYIHSASGLGADARYNLGLTNIFENSYGSAKYPNRGFQLGVFYQFKHH